MKIFQRTEEFFQALHFQSWISAANFQANWEKLLLNLIGVLVLLSMLAFNRSLLCRESALVKVLKALAYIFSLKLLH